MAAVALPPAAQVLDRTRHRNAVVVGALLYGVSALVLVAGLIAAFTTFRGGDRGNGWPPDGFSKQNYLASMGLMAAGMLLLVGEWLVWATRHGERRQAAQAGAISLLLLAAMVNAAVTIGNRADFAVGAHSYGTVFYAFLTVAVVVMAVAMVASVVALIRLGTRQVSPSEPQLARATSIATHVAALTWVMVWGCLFAASR